MEQFIGFLNESNKTLKDLGQIQEVQKFSAKEPEAFSVNHLQIGNHLCEQIVC